MGSSSHLRRCQFNCLADSNVGHAAANTARHHRVNVAVTGIGKIFQQRGCLHDLSRLAIAALGNLQARSEEHTSELQSHLNLVCRLLLEKKKYTNAWVASHRLA